MYEPYDIINSLPDDVLVQYSESPNFLKYLEILSNPFQELEEVFADILTKRELENAQSAQLSVNGELVVLSRGVYDSAEFKFFGLDDEDINNPVAHLGFGDSNDPLVGGYLRSLEQPIADRTFLSDDDYLGAIKSKISKNNFKGGIENVISIIVELFDFSAGETIEIIEDFTTPDDPFVLFSFHKILDQKQKSLLSILDLLPRGGGIRYEYEDTNGPF